MADSVFPAYPVRAYAPDRDRDAVFTLFCDAGWAERDRPGGAMAMEALFRAGPTWVTSPEDLEVGSVAATADGEIRWLDASAPTCVVTAVLTSLLARRRGLGLTATAHAVMQGALRGMAVATLGVFDQGYYDRLGFGTATPELTVAIDPAELDVDVRPRAPERLSSADAEPLHRLRMARLRVHGSVNITSPEVTRENLLTQRNGFGLGYRDERRELTHAVWLDVEGDAESGTYSAWPFFRTPTQLRELMALLAGLGDQVHLVRILAPAGVALQDLVRRPIRSGRVRSQSRWPTGLTARGEWQVRINDIERCFALISCARDLRFAMEVTDPIEAWLPEDAAWRGVGGRYVVELGPTTRVEPGRSESLPTLRTTVNALSRWWLGVAPATVLACTDDFAADPELMAALDASLRLPTPHRDWQY